MHLTSGVDAIELLDFLKSIGLRTMSGVPDSTSSPLFTAIEADPDIRYIGAVREDAAIGIASAAYLSGELGAVIMQNSGIGNVVNALTSFNLIYRIPVLLVIGWRGFGGPPNDAPEHWVMGAKTAELLDVVGVRTLVFDPKNYKTELSELVNWVNREAMPGAVLVKQGDIL